MKNTCVDWSGDLNVARHSPMCSLGLKGCLCMCCSPYLHIFFLSICQISLSLNLAQMSSAPRIFLWLLLPWMYPALPPFWYMCVVLIQLAWFSLSLSFSSLGALWGQGLSLHLCKCRRRRWSDGLQWEQEKEEMAYKTSQDESIRDYGWWMWLNIDYRIFAAILLLYTAPVTVINPARHRC